MNNPSKKILLIGEAMLEMVLTKDALSASLGFAGDSLNTAIYLKRALGESDFDVQYVSAVGRDSHSDRLIKFIASKDIGTQYIGRHPTRHLGLYGIETDAAGERSFTYWRSASAARTLFETESGVSLDQLRDAYMIYFSAISLAILPQKTRLAFLEILSEFRKTGGLVAFDSNFRPKLWQDNQEARELIAAAWKITDIALPSIDDEMACFGDHDRDEIAARLKSYGIKAGALKQGATGPFSLSTPIDASYPMAPKVVDATAAGDSFNGGYLAAYLQNQSQEKCLMQGHRLASKVIGHKGAIMLKS